MDIAVRVGASSSPVRLDGTVPATRQLEPGQRFNMLVLAQIDTRLFLLQVQPQGSLLKALAPQGLQTGQTVAVEVQRGGLLPELKLVSSLAPESPALTPRETSAQQALRALLPRQENLSVVHERLRANFINDTPRNQLPAPVADALRRIVQSLPQRAELATAKGVEAALLRSGLFSSSQRVFASGANPISDDLKQQLADLRQQISASWRNLPGSPTFDHTSLPNAFRNFVAASALADRGALAAESAILIPRFTQDAATNAELPSGEVQSTLTRSPEPAESAQTIRGVALPPEPTPLARDNGNQMATAKVDYESNATFGKGPELATETHQKALLADLAKTAEAGQARLLLDQLASATAPDSTQLWQSVLPFLEGEQLQSAAVTIQKHKGKSNTAPESAAWQITVEISPPGLGPITATLSGNGGNVDAVLSTASSSSAKRLESHLPVLRMRLADNLMNPGSLIVAHETPDKSKLGTRPNWAPWPLIDETA